jgi:hypothetical protein
MAKLRPILSGHNYMQLHTCEISDEHQCYVLKITGHGAQETPAMTMHGLHSLLMCLARGSKVSEVFKDSTLKILQHSDY